MADERKNAMDPLGPPTGNAGDHEGKISSRTKARAGGKLPAGRLYRRGENEPPESTLTGSQAPSECPPGRNWLKPLTQISEYRKQKQQIISEQ